MYVASSEVLLTISIQLFKKRSLKGWYNHIYIDHNVYHLLFYMISI